MTNLDSIFLKKTERDHFANKVPYSQSYGFSSSHIQMWEMDHKEGWVLKNWCFRTVVLEKTLESPLNWKKIKPVNLKGNKPWLFIGRTDAESEGPLLWPSNAKKQLIAHEFEQTPGNVKGHGSLAYCSSGIKKSRTLISNWIITTASLRLDNILLYINTKFYSPIHLLMDTDCLHIFRLLKCITIVCNDNGSEFKIMASHQSRCTFVSSTGLVFSNQSTDPWYLKNKILIAHSVPCKLI